jgi:hypothetical protein
MDSLLRRLLWPRRRRPTPMQWAVVALIVVTYGVQRFYPGPLTHFLFSATCIGTLVWTMKINWRRNWHYWMTGEWTPGEYDSTKP